MAVVGVGVGPADVAVGVGVGFAEEPLRLRTTFLITARSDQKVSLTLKRIGKGIF